MKKYLCHRNTDIKRFTNENVNDGAQIGVVSDDVNKMMSLY